MKIKSKFLAEVMMKRGENQSTLAIKAGVSRQTIGAMLAGTRMPGINKAAAIAKELGVAVDDLIDFTEVEAPVIRNTKMLRDLIMETMEKKGISNAEELCRMVGYDKSETVAKLLSGQKSWFPDLLSAVLETLGIEDAPLSDREKELLLPAGTFQKDGALLVRPIPVVAWANAASSIQSNLCSGGCIMEHWDENTETVLVPAGNRSISQAFRVSGVSMEPTLYDNDTIIVEHKENFEAINDRKVVVVKFSDDFPGAPGVVCKRIRKSGDTLRLTSDNPQGEEYEITPENKEFVEWVGQVVQVQSNRGL